MSQGRSLTIQARGGEELCPFCRERFARGERVLVCEGCQAPYHADCMRTELGRCATIGCSGRRALPRAFGADAPSPPVRVEPPRQAPPPDRTRCSACREALKIEERVLECARCGAEYHPACAGRLVACSHRGCGDAQALHGVHGRYGRGWQLLALGAAGCGLLLAAYAVSQAVRRVWPDPVLVLALVVLAGTLALIAWVGRRADRPVPFGVAPGPPEPPPEPSPVDRRCATCGGAIVPGEPRLLECQGCNRLHHARCLREAGRCQVTGCSGTRAVPRRTL